MLTAAHPCGKDNLAAPAWRWLAGASLPLIKATGADRFILASLSAALTGAGRRPNGGSARVLANPPHNPGL